MTLNYYNRKTGCSGLCSHNYILALSGQCWLVEEKIVKNVFIKKAYLWTQFLRFGLVSFVYLYMEMHFCIYILIEIDKGFLFLIALYRLIKMINILIFASILIAIEISLDFYFLLILQNGKSSTSQNGSSPQRKFDPTVSIKR